MHRVQPGLFMKSHPGSSMPSVACASAEMYSHCPLQLLLAQLAPRGFVSCGFVAADSAKTVLHVDDRCSCHAHVQDLHIPYQVCGVVLNQSVDRCGCNCRDQAFMTAREVGFADPTVPLLLKKRSSCQSWGNHLCSRAFPCKRQVVLAKQSSL